MTLTSLLLHSSLILATLATSSTAIVVPPSSSEAAPVASPTSVAPTQLQNCDFNLKYPPGSTIGPDTLFTPVNPETDVTVGTADEAIELRIRKPQVEYITINNGTNSFRGIPGMLNSTFVYTFKGRVTLEAEIHTVPGIVGGLMLIGEDYGPEIDLLVSAREPNKVQSNMFVTPVGQPKSYGMFDASADFPDKQNASSRHSYTIEWDQSRITTRIADQDIRVISKGIDDNGIYPGKPMRIQFGLWDVSNDKRIMQWAGGPVNWDAEEGQDNIKMVVYGIRSEC